MASFDNNMAPSNETSASRLCGGTRAVTRAGEALYVSDTTLTLPEIPCGLLGVRLVDKPVCKPVLYRVRSVDNY